MGEKREREVEKNGRRGGRGREKEWEEERGRKKKKNAGVCGAIIRLVGYIKGGKRGGGGKRQGRGGRGEEGEIERESTYSLHPEKARSLRHLPLRFWRETGGLSPCPLCRRLVHSCWDVQLSEQAPQGAQRPMYPS